MRRIIAATDVLLCEQRHPKGTEFDVADAPDPKATPLQVGSTTAAHWVREGWATEKPAKATK